jgi:hypothetical protein
MLKWLFVQECPAHLRRSQESEAAEVHRLREQVFCYFFRSSRVSSPLFLPGVQYGEGEGTGKICVLHFMARRDTLPELVISEVKSRRVLGDIKHKSSHCGMRVDKKWSKFTENVRKQVSIFFFQILLLTGA